MVATRCMCGGKSQKEKSVEQRIAEAKEARNICSQCFLAQRPPNQCKINKLMDRRPQRTRQDALAPGALSFLEKRCVWVSGVLTTSLGKILTTPLKEKAWVFLNPPDMQDLIIYVLTSTDGRERERSTQQIHSFFSNFRKYIYFRRGTADG